MLDMKYKMTSLLKFFSKIWKIFPYGLSWVYPLLKGTAGNSLFLFIIYKMTNYDIRFGCLKNIRILILSPPLLVIRDFATHAPPTCPISILGFANLAKSWWSEKNQLKLGAYAIADTQLKISNLLYESVTLR